MSKNNNQYHVALFPIPNMVSFPGTRIPLHVFEPRYRAMVKHCQENHLMLAVCHTKKAIGPTTPRKQFQSQLNKNQNSYEPHDVFSAGHCSLAKTTEDGRMYVDVDLSVRLKKLKVVQQVPFQIAACETLSDIQEPDLRKAEFIMMSDINEMLLSVSKKHSPELHEILSDDPWKGLQPAEFSFKLFKYFRFSPDFMQHTLEETSVIKRLQMIAKGLKQTFKH